MRLRRVARSVTPSIVWNGLRGFRRSMVGKENNGPSIEDSLCLTGDYRSWDAALAESTGYDTAVILEKTRDALLQVKSGEAIYERDSVLFDEVQYAWPVLAGLMWAAAQHGGSLNVLDFGGSLGSTYFQNRAFLAGIHAVRWNIVEQPQQVDTGKRYFEDDILRFYPTIQACLAETQPQVILLSSVLQYVQHPYDLLDELSITGCRCMIIDRTPFWTGTNDRLLIQQVPTQIYAASYPIWVFSWQKFLTGLSRHWELKAEFDSLDRLPNPISATWHGVIASIKSRDNKRDGTQ